MKNLINRASLGAKKTNYLFKARWLQGAASANESKKMQVNPRITPFRFACALDSLACRLRVLPSRRLRMAAMLCMLLTLSVGNVWGADATVDKEWNLTSSSSDFTSSNCVTYFSQPYGMKKANAYIQAQNIDDFKDYASKATKIEISVKCLQNGSTAGKLTVYLLDKDGTTLGSQEITPVNASSANSTTYQKATFTSSLSGATGFRVECTTFKKNILINGAKYVITYPACTGTKLGTPVVTATPSSGQIVLSWPAVSNASSYQLKWNGGSWTSATSPVTKTGLTNGTSYTYQVRAIGNGSTYCDGDASTEASATPNVYYTVTWKTNDGDYTTTSVVSGQKPTFPAVNPTSCDATSTTFVGWTQTLWSGKITKSEVDGKTTAATKVYTNASDMPTVSGAITYHAVYCKGGGGSVEVNTSNSGVSGSSYDNWDFTVSGIDFKATNWMKSTNIQAKASTKYSLYNVDAFAKDIASIQVIQTGTARAITVYGSNYFDEDAAEEAGDTFVEEQITSPSTSLDMTFSFSGKSFKYFYLSTPGNAVYMNSITINYGTAGSEYLTSCCTELGSINGSVSWSSGPNAKLIWDKDDNASEYVVKWKTHAGGEATYSTAYVTTIKDTLTNKKTCTVTSLTAGSEYDFKIFITGKTTPSAYCDKDTVMTSTAIPVTVLKQDETGATISDAGVTATASGRTLTASAGSTNYVFHTWKYGTASGTSIADASSATTSLTGTPTGDVIVIAEFYKPRTIVWKVNNTTYTPGTPGTATTRHNTAWSALTLPTDPDVSNYCGQKFVGWTTTDMGESSYDKDDDADAIEDLDLMTSENQSTKTEQKIIDATTTFHAVFADYAE